MNNEITLREYVDKLVNDFDRIHRAEDDAVKLQAGEDARLEELNHVHERFEDRRLC